MLPIVRWLLWGAVLIVPGGVLLIPLLAADAVRRRKATSIAPLRRAPASKLVLLSAR